MPSSKIYCAICGEVKYISHEPDQNPLDAESDWHMQNFRHYGTLWPVGIEPPYGPYYRDCPYEL